MKRRKRSGRTWAYLKKNPDQMRKHISRNTQRNKGKVMGRRRAALQTKRRRDGRDGKGGPDLAHRADGSTFYQDKRKNRANKKNKFAWKKDKGYKALMRNG